MGKAIAFPAVPRLWPVSVAASRVRRPSAVVWNPSAPHHASSVHCTSAGDGSQRGSAHQEMQDAHGDMEADDNSELHADHRWPAPGLRQYLARTESRKPGFLRSLWDAWPWRVLLEPTRLRRCATHCQRRVSLQPHAPRPTREGHGSGGLPSTRRRRPRKRLSLFQTTCQKHTAG